MPLFGRFIQRSFLHIMLKILTHSLQSSSTYNFSLFDLDIPYTNYLER